MVRNALGCADVPVVINALDNLPGSFDGLGARLDNAALLHEAGVTVLFTSGETQNARKLRQVAGNAVANGFPYLAAIEAMTSLPAEIFGGSPKDDSSGTRRGPGNLEWRSFGGHQCGGSRHPLRQAG